MKLRLPKQILLKIIHGNPRSVVPYIPEVVHIYTDDNGNNWYRYDDLMEMGILRKLQIDEIQSYAMLGVGKDAMQTLVKNLREALWNKNYVFIEESLKFVEGRMDFMESNSVYINLCAAMYLIEGEDIIKLDKVRFKKKQDILRKDTELQSILFSYAVHEVMAFYDRLATTFNGLFGEKKTKVAEKDEEDKKVEDKSNRGDGGKDLMRDFSLQNFIIADKDILGAERLEQLSVGDYYQLLQAYKDHQNELEESYKKLEKGSKSK